MPNRPLGPCVVIWDEAGVNVTFQKTFGGIFFRYEELRAPIKHDQMGETDKDEVTIGAVNPEVEVPMTEEQINALVHCFADASRDGSTLNIYNPVGERSLPFAKELIVKPIVNGAISTTTSEWLYLLRAFPRVTMEQAYDNSGQRTTKVIFKGFPDDISGRQRLMWRFGPES